MEDKDKNNPDKKSETKHSKETYEERFARFISGPGSFLPLDEEQAKMSEKEFREWVKSQGYYV